MATNDKITEEEVLKTLQQRLPEDKTAAELRKTLELLNKEHFAGKGKTKVVSFKKYYTLAAAAAVIVFVALLWPQGDYMDQFGKTQMITVTERGESSDSLLQQAAVHFNKNEFKQALPLLEKAVAADSANQMALFYLGVARLNTGSAVDARKDLEKIYNGESVFQYEAAFYIGLSYAEEKNTQMASEWLKKIPTGTNTTEKAEKLLKKLQ